MPRERTASLTTRERTSATWRLSGAKSAHPTTRRPCTGHEKARRHARRFPRDDVEADDRPPLRVDQRVNRIDVGRRRDADDRRTRRADSGARARGRHRGSPRAEDANGAGGVCNPHAVTSVATVISTASSTSMPASISAASIVSGGSRRTTVSLVRLTSRPCCARQVDDRRRVDRSDRRHASGRRRAPRRITGCFNASVRSRRSRCVTNGPDVGEQAVIHQLLEEEAAARVASRLPPYVLP